jgi:DNA-binding MarR family transcriptional regulator
MTAKERAEKMKEIRAILLSDRGVHTTTELAETLRISVLDVNRLADRLCKQGLIEVVE